MDCMNSQVAAQIFLAKGMVMSRISSAFGKLVVRARNEAVSLILNPERGLGRGILPVGGEPVKPTPTTSQRACCWEYARLRPLADS